MRFAMNERLELNMKLTRKCGVLIFHKALKSKRSGTTHNYWIAFDGTAFNLNVCNGYKMTTNSSFKTLKDALKHFENKVA